jgi:hypothetical protein
MGVKSKYEKGRLKFHSGAVDNEVVNISSAATTAITNYGVTLIKQASNAEFKFDPPVLGAHKTIIIADTTFEMTLIAAGATVNGVADNTMVVTPTTGEREIGTSFDFYGLSTILWYMHANIPHVSTSPAVPVVTFS